MTKDDPFTRALREAERLALASYPDLNAIDEQVAQARRDLDDLGADGKPSQKAKTAHRRLSNPGLTSTHPNRTVARLEKTACEAREKAEKAMAQALTLKIVATQAQYKLDNFKDRRERLDLVPPSREGHTKGEYNLRYLRPLYPHLTAHGVSRSSFARAPQWLLSTCAMLVGWGARDPSLNDPRNPARSLWRAGIIEQANPDMDPAEADAILSAMALGQAAEDQEITRLFGSRAALPGPVSPDLVMACARLAERADCLTRFEEDAVTNADTVMRSHEVRTVQAICGMTDEQADRAEAVIRFLKDCNSDRSIRELLQDFAVAQIKWVIDEVDPAGCAPEDWVPELTEKLAELATRLSAVATSEEAFFGLASAAFQHSFAKIRFAESANVREINERAAAIARSTKIACESGKPFKFNDMGFAVTDEDPQFHFIAQKPITKESYYSSIGFVPSDHGACNADLAGEETGVSTVSATQVSDPACPAIDALDDFEFSVGLACSYHIKFKVRGLTVINELDASFEDFDGELWDERSWRRIYGHVPYCVLPVETGDEDDTLEACPDVPLAGDSVGDGPGPRDVLPKSGEDEQAFETIPAPELAVPNEWLPRDLFSVADPSEKPPVTPVAAPAEASHVDADWQPQEPTHADGRQTDEWWPAPEIAELPINGAFARLPNPDATSLMSGSLSGEPMTSNPGPAAMPNDAKIEGSWREEPAERLPRAVRYLPEFDSEVEDWNE